MSLPVQIGALLPQLTARLQAAGCGEARLDARLLIAEATGLAPMAVFSRPETPLTPEQHTRLEQLAVRRCARQPMAQILGRRDFWTLTFRVTEDTLDPRPDSETLIEAILEQFPERTAPLRVLDLGVGTGCLLLTTLHEYPAATGMGIDRSLAALAVARDNAQTLGLAARVRFLQGDWLSGVDGVFDLVISNPPYIPAAEIASLAPEVATWEPRLALDGGQDGLDCYRHLAATVGPVLAPGGLVVFEVGAGQAPDVNGLLAAAGFTLLPSRRDLGGIERCVLARWPHP